ncbi:P-loop containing nucleoside triphosphate hydrolase protein [Pelagophyceae sp. CCMP2097]|nr:P-loop containing nucleoside triphosphate hydrolase protein [Pelagophyceae sp. CCMP2097]
MADLPSAEDTEAWRSKFVAFYTSNAPDKVSMVTDSMMDKWAGKYEALFLNLEKKYGKEGDPIAQAPAPARAPARGGLMQMGGRGNGGKQAAVGDFCDQFTKLIADAEGAAPAAAPTATARLVDGKVELAENGLETSTFTICARVRPVLPSDGTDGDAFPCIFPGAAADDGQHLNLYKPKVGLTGRPKLESEALVFDHCFGAGTHEDDVFAAVGLPLVRRALDGQVGVIFAYGQTGSGKTHTMGNLMARTVAALFADGADRRDVTFSYMEVLGSDAADCLADGPPVQIGEMLDGRVVLKNLSEHACESASAMTKLVAVANAKRSTACTAKNDASSRSHGVGVVTVQPTKGSGCTLAGRLYIIDLAGSERAADSKDHDKKRLDETKAINLSLMALKDCIRARTQASRPGAARTTHVPYKRSKLTQVMKDVFDIASPRLCATVVLAHVSPLARDVAHSANTLGYAAPLRVAVSAAPQALERDARDPALWDAETLVAWVAETAKCDSDAAAAVVGDLRGVQFAALPERAIFSRCADAKLAVPQAAAVYNALWTAVVDAKTRNRRADGTMITEADEAKDIADAAQALKDKAALWAEREKHMRTER